MQNIIKHFRLLRTCALTAFAFRGGRANAVTCSPAGAQGAAPTAWQAYCGLSLLQKRWCDSNNCGSFSTLNISQQSRGAYLDVAFVTFEIAGGRYEALKIPQKDLVNFVNLRKMQLALA